MPSTFFGMEIGRRALSANQLALDVVGQNTANVGTAGYSRQVAVQEETDPYSGDVGKPGQLGTGVTISSVTRVRNEYLDKQIYAGNSDQGALNNLRDILSRVESAYGEPSTTGVGSQLTAFFNSFADLSAAPESGASRAAVVNKAQALITAFHTVSDSMSQIAPDIKSRIASRIGDANGLAKQIAGLNQQIASSLQRGDHPNDLLDKRTALIGQLSGIVDVQVINSRNPETNQSTGEVQIDVGGFTLVNGNSSSPLPTAYTSANGQNGLVAADGTTIPIKGGEVGGLIQASTQLDGYRADLDTLAKSVISAVNQRHAAGSGLDGVTGRNFLTGSGAGDIAIDPAILKNPNAIAAASAPVPPATVAPGNGDNARLLAALSSAPVVGTSSLNQYFNARVAAVGADSQRIQAQADNQTKVVAQLQTQQSSESGVNLDEELTKLLQYQRAYQAAARIINVQDDVINRVINGLGVGAPGG